MNSLKRLEYCSGFTVEISAPAYNTTQRPIQVQLLDPHQEAAPARGLGIQEPLDLHKSGYDTRDWEGHLKKWWPCLRIALAPSSDSQPQGCTH